MKTTTVHAVSHTDHGVLKEIALTTISPIEKMVEYILKNYTMSKEEATEVSYDILNRAGAELGFKTKYSEC